MSRNEILDKLILEKLIAPNVADALKNNPNFHDLLIYFSSIDKAYCLVNGFSYEIKLDGNPTVSDRYKMTDDLFFKHAENFSKLVSKAIYGIDYFYPKQEVLMKIPELLSKYLSPMKWIESNTALLSDIELGSVLISIGEMLLQEIKQKNTQYIIQEKSALSKVENLSDDSSWAEVAEKTLKVCRGFVQGESITSEELYPLLCSDDNSDIVDLTLDIKDPHILVIIGHIINITSYILTLAFYKEDGKGCPLPEILDEFQGKDMSEIFITYLLDMIQDKLINKEKILAYLKYPI
ncbi:Imm6 family immunity protein [Clostridium lundense]|uniref:Imm6 family immunity protein n=1 Tax=Clostridium lundense TaxID=319475 RepID=UPI00047F6C18|nr:Imm6 family immunity protein [Clostridium lundense]